MDVEAEVVGPGNKVVNLGPSSPDQLAELEKELDQRQTAHRADTDAVLLLQRAEGANRARSASSSVAM
jgi:hypothetical protein